MPVALEAFVKQLADSGVIAPGKLENFIPPKAAPKDAQELARQLVQSKHLTKFQAQEIYGGRSKSLILGNYTILDKIGAGGMGQVFKAEHRRMHRLVAIKMLPAAMMKDAPAAARFQREVEAAAKLSHPNIVAAHDADEANGVHFLVMEYAEGSDLSALVKKNGPLPVAKAVNYILQAARGLEFAHGEGVVHRDIKPANLLLDKKGTVKILDMGLARIDGSGDAATQAELTGTGAVLGTVDYMAPEQALSTKHVDGRADIYSLGCSLYYLVTAHAAYDGDSLMAKLLAHREQPIPSLGAEVPEDVQAVFEKMVAKKVEDRYQTMNEVVAALEQCNSGQQSSVSHQQSVSTNPDADALTFLRDAPPHASQVQKKTKKAAPTKTAKKVAPSKSGKDNRKVILGGVGVGVLGLAILAGVIFKLKTKDGTLVVEIDQPDAVVQVLNEEGKVEITCPGEQGTVSISVDPGKHRLKVEKDGFVVYSQEIEVEKGGTRSIAAKLIPLKWNTPEFQKWVKEVASLSAEQQVEEVAKKLVELNPGFDGKVEGKIEGHLVTGLYLPPNNRVADISPVRALKQLKSLVVFSMEAHGPLSDLSPLKGIPLVYLRCSGTQVSDLSPLTESPLNGLNIESTRVSDLSSLGGMRLNSLECSLTLVSDLSFVKGMNLRMITFTPKNITKGIDVIRQIKSLQNIGTNWDNQFPPDEFWQKYDAGEFGKPPITTFNDPAFKKWMKEVAALPAEKQVEAVAKKLQKLNPGFDGRESHKIESEVVTELDFLADNVTDISPVRALQLLATLHCGGGGAYTSESHGRLSDLSPLKGMPLKELKCNRTPVSDLSSLAGMHLTLLDCGWSQVSDLSPLKGMLLIHFACDHTKVSDLSSIKGMRLADLWCGTTTIPDLSALRGMPLTELYCDSMPVSDLSPLAGMPLDSLRCRGTLVSDLSPLEGCQSLKFLGVNNTRVTPAAVAALHKALPNCKIDWDGSVKAIEPTKPITNINDPAFQQWMKTVAALPAEQQVEAVAKKLMELNPGFDGKEWHKIEGGVVTELAFYTDNLTDISPMRALVGLQGLTCHGSGPGKGILSDLLPLKGMPITHLDCAWTNVTDLSPLRGMHLTDLNCAATQVSDLSPLEGMPLTRLACGWTRVSTLSPLKGMQLAALHFTATPVSDLSPLQGMPLTDLGCGFTAVFDLSPLAGMSLVELSFTPKNITRGLNVIRQMKSLARIETDGQHQFSADEFWKKYDAGKFGKPDSTAGTPDRKPITNINDPAFQQWMKTVAALPAERQVEAVVKKLKELNPGFDGKVENFDRNGTPKIENGAVTELLLITDNVTDIAPLRAMGGLRRLICFPSEPDKSALSDLSPLQGMRLTFFQCDHTRVANLSPLAGMPLAILKCRDTQVSDLSPLKGMPLTELQCDATQVTDLSPLEGMPLTTLYCNETRVSDLSPLQGMNLKSLWLTPKNITKGIDVIRQMKSLGTITLGWGQQGYAPGEFWKKYDAGDFGKPITDFNSPAFQQWMKTVADMPAEKQVEAVVKKLQELNPGFDGKVTGGNGDSTPKIENGVVTEFGLSTDEVADISPLRALTGLKVLYCAGIPGARNGKFSNLSPLQGIRLTQLVFANTQGSDLSPLRGMPLVFLNCADSRVADLSPLKGMPLTVLAINESSVSDLSPLQGMTLEQIFLTSGDITKGMDALRQMKSLTKIGTTGGNELPPIEFWKKYDAGELNK